MDAEGAPMMTSSPGEKTRTVIQLITTLKSAWSTQSPQTGVDVGWATLKTSFVWREQWNSFIQLDL